MSGLKRMGRRGALAMALALLVGGCSATTGNLAAATTRDLDAKDLLRNTPVRHVIGRSCIDVIVVVPTAMPNFGDAIDAALRETGGRVLTNVRIGYELFYIPLIYGSACYVAEGDAR